MRICPLSGEPCMETCAWNVDGECAITKISYGMYLLSINTKGIKEELECLNDSSNGD